MNTLTVGQVRKAMGKNKYIVLREMGGRKIAVNCKVGWISKNKSQRDKKTTIYTGWYSCGLQEYISYKIPYYPKNKYHE